MSQHDYDISTADANTGVTMRAAINAALQALAGNNSGATEPATKYPYMWWADTTSGYLKQRNAANTAWITVMLLATALMSDSDKCDGFHASQTPSANQIPVLNSSGRLVLDGTDDGSSKIQTGGVIKAGSLILERFRITPSGRILAGPTLPTDNGVDALQVNGTIASKGIKLDGTASSDTNTLDYYKEGIFAVTGVGFSDATPPTVSWVYNRVGKTVTIVAAALSGTSNATTFSVTGLPEATRPSAQRVCFIRTRDSGGVWSLGMIFINTDGTATIHKTPNADAFTASGTKAIATTMISYII